MGFTDTFGHYVPSYNERVKEMGAENLDCPFCNRGDFDLIGLKSHLEKGQCETMAEVPSI